MNLILSMAVTGEVDKMIPSNCLLVLAAVAEAAGHRVRIVFPVQLEEFLKDPKELVDCDVFGMSVNSFNWYATKRALEIVHATNPRTKIVLGGPHPTYVAEHCLKTTDADVVFRGEAERSFPQFLEALEGGSSFEHVKGITYRAVDGTIVANQPADMLTVEEMNALPLPAFDKIPAGLYDFVPVETSRGCFFHCKFCALPFPQTL